MSNLDINSFKKLLDVNKFEKIKIGNDLFLNLSSIMPLSQIQNTLQNRIFIYIVFFVISGLIDNPYNNNDAIISFDVLNLENIPNNAFLINYKHVNTTLYSNIISNLIYLIINYVNIDLLENMYELNKKKSMSLPDITTFTNNVINDAIENNYSEFINFMEKLNNNSIFEINIIEDFFNKLFLNVSTFIIKKLNENETSTFTIEQNKIQKLFDNDFKDFSDYRKSFFEPCKSLFTFILKDNLKTNPSYKFVNSYFDEENEREDNRYLLDDVSTFNNVKLFSSKNIVNLFQQSNNDDKIKANILLIIVSSSVNELIYKLSDVTPLLLNLSQISNKSNINFNDIYNFKLKGGSGFGTYVKETAKVVGRTGTAVAAGLAAGLTTAGVVAAKTAAQFAPIMVQGAKGVVEIVKMGQNIPGLGVVCEVIKNEAGQIISASITTWTEGAAVAAATGARMASTVLTYTAATAGSLNPVVAGVGAAVAVGGLVYYYYGDAIADRVGISVPSQQPVIVPTPTQQPVSEDQQQPQPVITPMPQQPAPEMQPVPQPLDNQVTQNRPSVQPTSSPSVLPELEQTPEMQPVPQPINNKGQQKRPSVQPTSAPQSSTTSAATATAAAAAAAAFLFANAPKTDAEIKVEDQGQREALKADFRLEQEANIKNAKFAQQAKAEDKIVREKFRAEATILKQAQAERARFDEQARMENKQAHAKFKEQATLLKQAKEANAIFDEQARMENKQAHKEFKEQAALLKQAKEANARFEEQAKIDDKKVRAERKAERLQKIEDREIKESLDRAKQMKEEQQKKWREQEEREIDVQSYFDSLNNGLKMLDFGLRAWRWYKGLPVGDEPNEDVQKILYESQREKAIFEKSYNENAGYTISSPEERYKWYKSQREKLSNFIDILAFENKWPEETKKWNLENNAINIYKDGLNSLDMGSGISDWSNYGNTAAIPSTWDMGRYTFNYGNENVTSGWDMNSGISDYGNTNAIPSTWDMGTNLLNNKNENAASIWDMGIEKIEDSNELNKLLQNESDEVKELAIQYKITKPEEILTIKKIKEQQDLLSKMTTTGHFIERPKTQNNNLNITREYANIGPNQQFKLGDNKSGQYNQPWYKRFLNPDQNASTNTTTNNNPSIKVGGGLNINIINKIDNIINYFVFLKINNGKILFLIDERIANNLIQIISIYNSINYLENYKNIELLNNNMSSYNTINLYLTSCYNELNNENLIKGGKYIWKHLDKAKTKKNYKNHKNLKTRFKNKKQKGNIKSVKKNVIKKKKTTKRVI